MGQHLPGCVDLEGFHLLRGKQIFLAFFHLLGQTWLPKSLGCVGLTWSLSVKPGFHH